MTRRPSPLLIPFALLATLAACGSSDSDTDLGFSSASPTGVYFSSSELGVTINDFGEWAGSVEYLKDGSVEMFGDAMVSIDGKGERLVTVLENIEPVVKGGRQTVFIVDETTGGEHVFHYEPEDNAVVIGDADGGVFVFGNPDGSFDVVTARFDQPASQDEYDHAADGYAAYELVRAYNEVSTVTPHAMLMAYALAQGPAVESRSAQWCEEPNCGTGPALNGAASAAGVCTTFKAFCDCVACDYAGVGADCARCPSL